MIPIARANRTQTLRIMSHIVACLTSHKQEENPPSEPVAELMDGF